MVHKEGGQMPLYRRLPKRGFYNHFRVEYQVVNLDALAAQESVSTFDVPTLRRLRLIRFADRPVKILGRGDIGRAINVSAHAFARSAQEKIASAGGRCQTITTKTPATAGKKTA
jgi:large subunit ribosomal protein L15